MLAVSAVGCRSPESTYNAVKREVDRGELNSTLTQADAALRQYERNPEWEWRFRLLKARILVSRSQADETLSLLEPGVPLALASTEIPEQRKLYQGIAHRYKEKFEDAERDFKEAEHLATPLAPRYLCQLLIARAALCVDEKKYDIAQDDYREALALARAHALSVFEANTLADMARLSTSRSRFDEALDLYLVALNLAQSLEMKGNVATVLGNMGWSYFELGDFDNALDFYKQGAEVSGKSGLTGYSAYYFSGVANSYLALRDYAPAEELARATLKEGRRLKDAETVAICLNTLAEILWRTNRVSEAEPYVTEALKMEETGADKLSTLDSLIIAGDVASAQERFTDASNFFQRVLADPKAEARRRWEAEAGLAHVWEDQGRFLDAERQYLKAISTIEQARRSVNHEELRLSFLSSGMEVYGGYIDFLIRRGRSADALNEAELSRARTLAEGLSTDGQGVTAQASTRVSPQQVARRMHATLLFYWLGQKISYLWVIAPQKTTVLTLASDLEIAPVVKSYEKALVGGRDVLSDPSSDGQRLYSMLVEPARKLIQPGSRVIVLPSESLYGLNFETLIVPDPQPHFWIEDVTVTTASSLTLLDHVTKEPEAKERTLLLVGNTEQPSPDFPVLTQAKAEMQKIESYFPDTSRRVLEGKEASPSGYLSSRPDRYSYIHFVTHGTASQARPLESAVILSKEGDSYKLYARDVVQHHLNANLVTISACNGSGIRAYSGEGLVGLSWAFLRAGAHNVVAGLWEVSDVSTPQLMDALYSGLSQGKDPATALRNAKLAMLHSADAGSVFRKPFYWAPFQLYAGS